MLGMMAGDTKTVSSSNANSLKGNSDLFRIVDLLKCALAESKKYRNKELTYIISMAIISAEESKNNQK